MPSISEFAASIRQRGIAKPNRFICMIPAIRGASINLFSNSLMNSIITQVSGSLPSAITGTALICQSAEIPTRSFMTADKRESPKPVEQIPYIDTPGTMNLTFILGGDMYEYYFFEQWTNDVVNRETNLLNYYDEYTTSVIVTQLNEIDEPVAAVELEKAYPVSVSKVRLDMSANNTLSIINVELRYKKYRPILTKYSLAETALSLVNKASNTAMNVISEIDFSTILS